MIIGTITLETGWFQRSWYNLLEGLKKVNNFKFVAFYLSRSETYELIIYYSSPLSFDSSLLPSSSLTSSTGDP